MPRNICSICAVIFVLAIGLYSCDRADRLTLKLETYYYVFDNMFALKFYSRRALLRVDVSNCEDLSSGDSVAVGFIEKQGVLCFEKVLHSQLSPLSDIEYVLNGTYAGIDQRTGECLLGFVFKVTKSEFENSKMIKDHTRIINAHFQTTGTRLEFDYIEIIGETDAKPVFRK